MDVEVEISDGKIVRVTEPAGNMVKTKKPGLLISSLDLARLEGRLDYIRKRLIADNSLKTGSKLPTEGKDEDVQRLTESERSSLISEQRGLTKKISDAKKNAYE
jgi:hypothetical protein